MRHLSARVRDGVRRREDLFLDSWGGGLWLGGRGCADGGTSVRVRGNGVGLNLARVGVGVAHFLAGGEGGTHLERVGEGYKPNAEERLDRVRVAISSAVWG